MNTYRNPSCFAAAAICLAIVMQAPASAQAPNGPPSMLAPSVLIGGEEFPTSAWIADDVGRVAAVNLDSGAMNWRGPAEGLPMALVDGQLVVLGRPERSGQLSLLLLDPANGASLGRLVGELPEGVLASPYAQPNRTFKAVADSSTGTLRVFWSYAEWPLRGALLIDDAGTSAGRIELNGVVTFDLAANTMQLASVAGTHATVAADLNGSERVPGVEGTQFRSADGAHAQVASAVDHPVLGTAWRWTLHERSSGRAINQLLLPYAHAPFMLRANRLIWQSPPLIQREASGEYRVQSLRLVSQDLATGQEMWSIDLLDQEYRGVLPP